jgi:hypothetical protein
MNSSESNCLNLHFVKTGIAHVALGVGETEFERLKDEVLDKLGISSRKRGNIEAREDSQGEQNNNPLTVGRYFHHAVAAVIG